MTSVMKCVVASCYQRIETIRVERLRSCCLVYRLIDPQPDGYKEIARTDVLDGKCWTTPVLANGRIYARSTKEAACFDVSGK